MYEQSYEVTNSESGVVDFENRYVDGNDMSGTCHSLIKNPPSDYQRIIFNFSGVERIDNSALATLINLIFKHGCNNVEIHGASCSVRRALKVLNLDQYVVMKRNKKLLFF